MTKTIYEYAAIVQQRDVSGPGGLFEGPLKTWWHEGSAPSVELTGQNVMQILGRLGLDGWKLVGAPQFDQSYVYLLMTVDKGSPPKRIENSASSWMARTFWLMREVDGC